MAIGKTFVRILLALIINMGLFLLIPVSQQFLSSKPKIENGEEKTLQVVAEMVKPKKEKPKATKKSRIRSVKSSGGKALQSQMKFKMSPDITAAGSGDGAVIESSDMSAQVFEEGDVDQAAVAISIPQPKFPKEAKKLGIGGSVVILFTVGANGTVIMIDSIDAPHKSFEKSIRQAMGNWRFSPAMNQGVPVASKKSISIDFNLE